MDKISGAAITQNLLLPLKRAINAKPGLNNPFTGSLIAKSAPRAYDSKTKSVETARARTASGTHWPDQAYGPHRRLRPHMGT
jgi:hypothetical protein